MIISDDIICKWHTQISNPATNNSLLILQAFSDCEKGWAFYNGELRHGSNNDGKKYGEAVGHGDVVAVILDTIEVSRHSKVAALCEDLSSICASFDHGLHH